MTRVKPLHDRIAARTDFTDSCWLWTGSTSRLGYGRIMIGGSKDPHRGPRLVHRVAYELLVGPIPPGLEVDHLCGVRNCLHPDHLEVVDRTENNRRSAHGKGKPRGTHCRNGHEYTPDNTAAQKDGTRKCRTCMSERQRAYRLRLKENTPA